MITCFAFLLVAVSLISMVGEYLLTQKVHIDERAVGEVSIRAAEPLALMDADAMFEVVTTAALQNGGRMMITDSIGMCVADSESLVNGRRIALPEIESVLSGELSDNAYYGRGTTNIIARALNLTPGGTMLGLYTSAILNSGETIGVMVYASPSEEVYQNLSKIQNQMIIYLALVAVAVLILSFFVSRIFTHPINDLSEGIARMSQGDLSSRVTVRGRNEFSELAEAFNMMCERLESLDNIRNQFVSNASHELKTPLSTMKILIETLIYQPEYNPEMQSEFLGDINKEIDRLNAIVNDLLVLVHFDGGKMELNPIKLQLDELIRTTMRRLEPLAANRGIEITLNIVDSVETMADYMKLEQVSYNLIDNAIKYTQPGGKVHIELSRQNRKAVITVTDTGIGIPKSDVKHVFERFYRVDKARARETGGSGLGLSIVKQIVMLHEGTITVASEEDKGSTFTVELPIVNL